MADRPRAPLDIVARSIPQRGRASSVPGLGTPPAPVGDLVRIAYPWFIYPPRDALDFFRSAQVVLPIGPTTQELAPPLAGIIGTSILQIAPGFVGVIRDISIVVNAMTTTSDVHFRLLFNGGPVEGWNDIPIPARNAASVGLSFIPEGTVIRVPDAARVSWQAIVNDAVAYQVAIQYRGWYVSKVVADRYAA